MMNEQEYAEFGKGRFDTVSGSKLARIRQYAGKSILDVGCGPGAYLQALSNLNYQVAGIEKNQVFIEQARLVTAQVYRVDLEMEALSRFRDDSFDTVLMLDIIEHLDRDHQLLMDAFRVCRQNVILTVPARMPDSFLKSQIAFASYVDPTHRHYYAFRELKSLLEKVGFAKVIIESVLRFDPILYWLYSPSLRWPLSLLNRVLMKLSDPELFTTVWFAVGWKSSAEK
jgi:2-polyprenyl-3-methyl-5-hydroxy-6-metoxy-1,4-benzoquinol methylase